MTIPAHVLAAIKAANTGRKHTPAELEKMAQSHMGQSPSKETRAKISAALRGRTNAWRKESPSPRRGKKVSAKALANMRAARRKPSAEARRKMSLAMSKRTGAANPAWAGGASRLPYGWDYSPELRAEIRRRDGHKCQVCGASQSECSKKLSVHHVDYNPRNSDPVNLLSLCNGCHRRVHANKKHWKGVFQAVALERSIKERTSKA